MVDAVSNFDAGAYLNQIKGLKIAPATPAAATTASNTTVTDQVQLPSNVIALLQETNSFAEKNSSLSNLLNSSSTTASDPLAGLYNTLLSSKTSAATLSTALAATEQKQAQATATNDSLQNILTSYHKGFSAYNKVLQQNAQAVLDQVIPPLSA